MRSNRWPRDDPVRTGRCLQCVDEIKQRRQQAGVVGGEPGTPVDRQQPGSPTPRTGFHYQKIAQRFCGSKLAARRDIANVKAFRPGPHFHWEPAQNLPAAIFIQVRRGDNGCRPRLVGGEPCQRLCIHERGGDVQNLGKVDDSAVFRNARSQQAVTGILVRLGRRRQRRVARFSVNTRPLLRRVQRSRRYRRLVRPRRHVASIARDSGAIRQSICAAGETLQKSTPPPHPPRTG